jgi:SEC-C motif-containing protein
MRSRYSAYALGLVDYVIDTTDPEGPLCQPDRAAWAADVRRFCTSTRFSGVEIRSSHERGDVGEVTFFAKLRRGGRDVSFAERSLFVRIDGRWLYHDGSPA